MVRACKLYEESQEMEAGRILGKSSLVSRLTQPQYGNGGGGGVSRCPPA